MNIIKTKVKKIFDKTTKKPILEIGLRIEIEKLIEIKRTLGDAGTEEIFQGLIKNIKKECNC